MADVRANGGIFLAARVANSLLKFMMFDNFIAKIAPNFVRRLSASLYLPCDEFGDINRFVRTVGIAKFVGAKLLGVWSRELRCSIFLI